MVNINVWPAMMRGMKARVDSGENTSWLSFRDDTGTEITIFGSAEHADKLRMMADIFNDAFAPEKAERAKMIATHNAAIENDDLPF